MAPVSLCKECVTSPKKNDRDASLVVRARVSHCGDKMDESEEWSEVLPFKRHPIYCSSRELPARWESSSLTMALAVSCW